MTKTPLLTNDEANALRSLLSKHYGEPVRPVSEYCESFRSWHKALTDKVNREEGDEYGRDESLIRAKEALDALVMPIYKSSCLARLIYGEEELRTEMCPEHKGRWVGLPFGDNDCKHGCQYTGWLPNKEDK